jgi:hypothetical protein
MGDMADMALDSEDPWDCYDGPERTPEENKPITGRRTLPNKSKRSRCPSCGAEAGLSMGTGDCGANPARR